MSEKIYAPVTIKAIKTQYGTLLKFSCHAEKFGGWIRQHANEKGYVNLNINERKTPGQFGDTHSAVLDTWKPTPRNEQPEQAANNDDVP